MKNHTEKVFINNVDSRDQVQHGYCFPSGGFQEGSISLPRTRIRQRKMSMEIEALLVRSMFMLESINLS
jgi:hypothetical protein